MTFDISELIDAADGVRGMLILRNGDTGTIGAAILSRKGHVFTGTDLGLASGLGCCAEYAATVEMLKSKESEIVAMVAVGPLGILPPCGACRELLMQLSEKNLDCEVVLDLDRTVPLRNLLPDHWLDLAE